MPKPKGKRRKCVLVYLDQEDIQILRKIASFEGLSISSSVRKLVREFIEKEKDNKKIQI